MILSVLCPTAFVPISSGTIENSYAWGLSGYTALIIAITIQTEPLPRRTCA